MYSFNKTRHDSDHWEFRQKNFQQGKRHLLHEVKRKTRNLAGTQPRSKLEALLADMSQLKVRTVINRGNELRDFGPSHFSRCARAKLLSC